MNEKPSAAQNVPLGSCSTSTGTPYLPNNSAFQSVPRLGEQATTNTPNLSENAHSLSHNLCFTS